MWKWEEVQEMLPKQGGSLGIESSKLYACSRVFYCRMVSIKMADVRGEKR